jgi:hypothetical protein
MYRVVHKTLMTGFRFIMTSPCVPCGPKTGHYDVPVRAPTQRYYRVWASRVPGGAYLIRGQSLLGGLLFRFEDSLRGRLLHLGG